LSKAREQRTELIVGPTNIIIAEEEIDRHVRLIQSLT
jgi:hypothetical protein